MHDRVCTTWERETQIEREQKFSESAKFEEIVICYSQELGLGQRTGPTAGHWDEQCMPIKLDYRYEHIGGGTELSDCQ